MHQDQCMATTHMTKLNHESVTSPTHFKAVMGKLRNWQNRFYVHDTLSHL